MLHYTPQHVSSSTLLIIKRTMMHGQKNIKLCNAEQTKRVYQYKNIKLKLYKNNAAIWYNEICRVY